MCVLRMIIAVIRHVLRNETLDFDGSYYEHILETTTGPSMAPTLATLYIGFVEGRILSDSI